MSNLSQVVRTFSMNCEKPAMFGVGTDRWHDWDRVLRSSLNPAVKVIICVLPGAKGKCRLYDDLKRLTFSTFPVPNQVVLTSTLKRDKGLRSVVNKLIMQINAKVGGVPWALNSVPFQGLSCMVIGIDVFSKRGAFGVLGFCATMDCRFSEYASFPKILSPGGEIFASLRQALQQYQQTNKKQPQLVIVFRDGVSDSQRQSVLSGEVGAMRQAFEHCKSADAESPRLAYVIVNKRTNARFYQDQKSGAVNPPLGTVVDSKVVEKDGYDFYVLPAKANQGSMTPTHFHVVYDDTGVKCDELQILAYRMCYSYYNWSGSIRVPAPCQYAHKLAYNYGERSDQNGPPVPHEHWAKTRSLYFL
jgi:aubergine